MLVFDTKRPSLALVFAATCILYPGEDMPIPTLPETLSDPNVPTLVRDEAVTPDARVPPVNVPAGAVAEKAKVPRVPPVPTLSVEPSVPANVRELLADSVLALAIVKTADVPGFVIVTLLTVVAVAAPMVGVVNVGLVASTMLPVPCGALPIAVKTVLLVVTVEGATPAPPPITMAFAARAADDNHVVPLLK